MHFGFVLLCRHNDLRLILKTIDGHWKIGQGPMFTELVDGVTLLVFMQGTRLCNITSILLGTQS